MPTMTPGCLVPAYDDRCEAWVASAIDGPGHGTDIPGEGLLATHMSDTSPDGKFAFVSASMDMGPSGGSAHDYDAGVIAYDQQTGEISWSHFIPGFGERSVAFGYSVAAGASGVYLAVWAMETDFSAGAAFLIALDPATGTERWSTESEPVVGWPQTVATSPDGARVYLGGVSSTLVGGQARISGYVAAHEAADPDHLGERLWISHYAGTDSRGALLFVLAVAPDGSRVFLTGGDGAPDGLRKNFATVAFEAEEGQVEWVARDALSDPAETHNGAIGVAVSPDSSKVFVTGVDPLAGSFGTSNQGILTVGHDAETGEALWRGRYESTGSQVDSYYNFVPGPIVVSRDGSKVIVSSLITGSAFTGYREGIATVAYDTTTGQQAWEARYIEYPYRTMRILPFYPTISASPTTDQVFVTGPRGNSPYSQYVTLAYDTNTGSQQWIARFLQGSSVPVTIATARDGRRVFVAGIVKPIDQVGSTAVVNNSWDIVTVAYDTATGA